jgi:hypothetical protein
MGGDLEVEQLTPSVADEEDDIEGLKSQGLDHKEVGCPNRLSMVGEEGCRRARESPRVARRNSPPRGAGAGTG